MTMFENNGQEESIDEASQFLEIYKQSLPVEFDLGVKRILDSSKSRWSDVMKNLGLRREFVINATQGNLSRILIEADIFSLAQNLGLKTGIFKTKGGSHHMKISTDNLILTVHTFGDRDGEMSRFTQYKQFYSKSNPMYKYKSSKNITELICQGSLFRDIDIGLPSLFPDSTFVDKRLYATLCIPRFLNLRNQTKLILPDLMYSGFIFECEFLDIRVSESKDISINLYSENTIDPTQIILKKDNTNEIIKAEIQEKKEDDNISESS
ncbi:hypothetical protein RIF25_04670 [Thermosynechococcaceae cyanobacterium BACA0444]|uniref:Uncharacterized protein n=1 Tax=Pseudocalidococcus azoricus BACA0444 TaxID=2918990 RepID=A0AAE4JYT6_9CYAN|nr:hypothetical protein [Pseudocalidococcus azoricus]MDS3860097.1 hypothetical protein [Pseudocalidococcus azoricus BACA0444]